MRSSKQCCKPAEIVMYFVENDQHLLILKSFFNFYSKRINSRAKWNYKFLHMYNPWFLGIRNIRHHKHNVFVCCRQQSDDSSPLSARKSFAGASWTTILSLVARSDRFRCSFGELYSLIFASAAYLSDQRVTTQWRVMRWGTRKRYLCVH